MAVGALDEVAVLAHLAGLPAEEMAWVLGLAFGPVMLVGFVIVGLERRAERKRVSDASSGR